jgi:hypothetical protein
MVVLTCKVSQVLASHFTVPVLLFLNHTLRSPFGEDVMVVLVKDGRRCLLDVQLSKSHFPVEAS